METVATALDLYQRGRLSEAEAACVRILAAAPEQCDALTLLAELRTASDRAEAAIEPLRTLAVLQPRDAANLRRLADALLALGRPEEAVDVLRRAIATDSRNVRGHNNLGRALMQLGRLPEASACFEQALEIEPGYAIARMNLATVLERLNQIESALAQYDRVLGSSAASAAAWAGRGALLSRLNRAAEALSSFEHALQLRPDDAETLSLKAAALLSLERAADAMAAADEALARQPDSAMAMHVKAAALSRLHRPGEALPYIVRALEIAPADLEAWCHRAIVHQQLGDHAASIECYRRALELDPSYVAARTGLISGLIPAVPMSAAEAAGARFEFDRELAAFERWLEDREVGENDAWTVARQSFFYLSYEDVSNRALLQRYRRASAARLGRLAGGLSARSSEPPQDSRPGAPPTRFRLGIVSAHVSDHSVFNAITRGWLERISRDRFETTLFSLGVKHDVVSETARRSVERFEAEPRTLPDWARLIRRRELDALIFPEVGIDRNTLSLANLRLAPRQLAAWGHPETTGLPTIDAYLSADAFEPADADEHYSERLVRLPHLGVYYRPDAVEPAAVDLEALGVPDRGPLLVCPGAPFKYRPQDDAVLVEIARRLERCTFLFFAHERQALSGMLRARLSAAFAAAGLSPDRLLAWIPWQPRSAFLGILARAHVYLDTIGFSGFNTLMQAIEVNLPCVAYDGRLMRGRLGSGILRRLGLYELIASSREMYADIAVRLAMDAVHRRRIIDRLRASAPRAYADQSAVDALERMLLDGGLTAR